MFNVEYFIGRCYPIYKKGTLIFTKHLGKTEEGFEEYEMICTLCSEDKEIYPEPFKITRERFSENFVPCSCSHAPIHTKDQLAILKRRAKLLNVNTVKGFNPTKEGNLYLTLWEGLGKKYLKVGITNREVCKREEEQTKRGVGLLPTTLRTYHHVDGFVIENLEKDLLLIKNKLVSTSEQKEIKNYLPDGYTEVFPYTEKNLKLLQTYFDNLK
jgi:hypothetical protein